MPSDATAAWRVASGACVSCGVPSGINPLTGLPFRRCFKHRVSAAAAQRRRYRESLTPCRAFPPPHTSASPVAQA